MKRYKVTYKLNLIPDTSSITKNLINLKIFSLIYTSEYDDIEITKFHVENYLMKYFNRDNFKIIDLKEVV
jgi:hypothetical protein